MAGVKRYEDLDVWRLAVELRNGILRLTETGPVTRDFKFRDQIRDSSSSPPRNIAEGFGRVNPQEFAQFLRVARGSLQETRNHLQDGEERKYFSHDDAQRLLTLQKRASAATTALLKYLESCKRKRG